MKKIIRLLFINIVVFLTILIFINFSAVLIFKSYKLFKSDQDPRRNLPNYENIIWAENHFREFNDLPAEYRSYIGWRRLPFNGETIRIDESGIRSTLLPSTDLNSLPVVAFTGGSALWGTGSDDNNTIPSQFTEISGGGFHSLNFGESGYNAFQGYLFLKIQVMNGLTPSIIVSYDGANEIDALQKGSRIFSHSREDHINSAVKGLDRDEDLTLRHFFIDPLLAFVNKFRAKLHKTDVSDFDISPERLDNVATTFLRSWKSVKDLADQNHADFIGVLQPTIYRGNPRTDQLEVDKSLQSVYLAFYTTVFKKLKEPEFIGLSDCVLDLENAFDGEELIYIDDVHVSPNGNRIAANKIYNFILDLRQKKINNNHGMVN